MTNFCLAFGAGNLLRVAKVKEDNKNSRICYLGYLRNWIEINVFCKRFHSDVEGLDNS